MRTLYLECGMGAAGDMLTAALLELLPDRSVFFSKMNALGLPGVSVSAERISKQGIMGTQMHILINGREEESADDHECHAHEHHHETGHHHGHEHHHEHDHGHTHHHASMSDILNLIGELDLSDAVKQKASAVYQLIAEAESHAHGCDVSEIHFHEVGTKDAVADIVGVCLLMEMLAPERVIVSPVHVGSGHVRCAHGILPVPAPATAYILRGVPICTGGIKGELCTPTGAALLKTFADEFAPMPVMRITQTGYGFGRKEFRRLNCVRAFLGELDLPREQITEIVCNLDDMTGEEIAFAQEMLLKAGALDVFTSPVYMKKGRPAVMLTCLCRTEQREAMTALIFRHTSTLGVRIHVCERDTLTRRTEQIETALGTVRVKCAEGCGVTREKPEFDDLARIAEEQSLSLRAVAEIVKKEKQGQ
ncbi:MAG: nickel pincer cofactor biosynthesis protein LarC [Oscillospiraceae bacterium]|nr:nickel pincer cofactor biosynthesis protein LarC [Oscillospiraceae bacterium]